MFRFDGTIWSEVQRLTGFDPANELFGRAVAISGDVVIVGVPTTVDQGGTGAAYVFRFDGSSWLEEQKLTAFDPDPIDRFGHSVSVSGDTIIVGATEQASPASASGSGAAYVFRFDGTSWLDEQKLTAFLASAGRRGGDRKRVHR